MEFYVLVIEVQGRKYLCNKKKDTTHTHRIRPKQSNSIQYYPKRIKPSKTRSRNILRIQ